LLIDHAGFEWAFTAMAVLPLVAWLCIRIVKELPKAHQPAGDAKRSAWDLLNEPMFRRLLMVNWFLSACWDIHTFVVPILGHERGISASAIGTILGSFAMAAAFVRMMMPFIAARLHEWQVITGAMVVTSAVLAVYPFTSTAVFMGVCSVMLGLSLGGVQPMVMSTLHQITPEHRHGEALGLRLMGINASSVLMPMVFGAAGTVIGISGVFWCVSAVVGLGSRSARQLRVHKTHE
jgi:predicted MFS family arabinose efflux permease